MMKRSILLLIIAMCALVAFAQTQQGYVKTLGRPNQKGVALSGVSVRVKGGHNAVLSGHDGTFAMAMPGKKLGDAYALQQVQKQGYELRDKAAVGRQYAYSDKVPLTLVMASSAQLRSDKQRIENKAYEVAERGYKQRLAALEQQKNTNAITIEQYRQELSDLQDKFEKYQSLIDGLAEHYALVDYDALDEQEREITLCIENGDLERADSLLQQLGVQQRAEDIAQRLKAGQRLMDEALQEQAEILKRQEKDAEYLYQLYTIALAKFDNDKARFYIETRAELDTTNVEWQMDAGGLFFHIAYYDMSLQYFKRALRYVYNPENNAYCTFNIGRCYYRKGDIVNSRFYYDKLLSVYKEDDSQSSQVLKALVWSELAEMTFTKKEYQSALQYVVKAKQVFQTKEGYELDYAASLLLEANTLNELGDTNGALKLVNTAINTIIAKEDEDNVFIGTAYSTQGNIYYKIGYLKAAMAAYQKAQGIYLLIYGENHPEVATLYNNMSAIYVENGELDKAKKVMQKAIDIFSLINNYHPTLSTCYLNLGRIYKAESNYEQALVCYAKCLEIRKALYEDNHYSLAVVYDFMGVAYYESGNYDMSLKYLKNALNLYEKYLPENHENIQLVKKNIQEALKLSSDNGIKVLLKKIKEEEKRL